MQLFDYQIRPNTNLFLFGDDHEGVSARYEKGWKRLVAMMNDKYKDCSYNIGVDHGDIVEAIMIDDKRYSDIGIKHDKLLKQIDRAITNRLPIKDKIVCILTGNHDFKLWRFGNIAKHVADTLSVRYGDWTSVISYKTQSDKLAFKHYACHGTSAIRSQAGPRIRKHANIKAGLQDRLKDLAGDCFLMSQRDIHQLIVVPPDESLFLFSEKNHLKSSYTNQAIQQTGVFLHEDLRWYCATGSFLRSRIKDGITYAEMKGLRPNQLGFLIAVIRDYKLISIDEIRL